MSPFDQPPAGTPVSFEPPEPPAAGPRRGRMVAVALVTAGFIGGGIAGVSQLVSADQPELAVSATDEPDESVPPVDEDSDDESSDEGTSELTGEESVEDMDDTGEVPDETPDATVETDGEIVVDTGDGDPVVIDLGEIVSGDIGRLTECIGLPMFDFDLGDLGSGDWGSGDWGSGDFPIGNLDELLDDLPFDLGALENLDLEELDGQFGDFGTFDIDGGSVTVTGPDGVSVIDLGENGSVTVTKDGDGVTVSTDGDATVSDLEELFGDFDLGKVLGDFGVDLGDGTFDDFFESLPAPEELPALDELPEFGQIDPDAVQACLDEVLGN